MADQGNIRVVSFLFFMFCKIKKEDYTVMVDNIANHDKRNNKSNKPKTTKYRNNTDRINSNLGTGFRQTN